MRIAKAYWVPTVIFLISSCFHFFLISKGPVTVDCLNLVIKAQATIETHQLHYLFGSGYPMMVLLGSIFITLGKWIGIADPVLAVNFIGVVFGSIAVLAFYLLVQEICHDTLTSIIASFILLLDPLFIDVSTYGINHAPCLCFLLLGLLSLVRYQRSADITGLFLSALYIGLMGSTRLQDFILTFPAIASLFILGLDANPPSHDKDKAHHFLLFFSVIILVIMSFHLPYLISNQTSYESQAKFFWKIGFTENYRVLFFRSFRFTFLYLYYAFSLVGIVYAAAGLCYIAKINRRLLVFILLWLSIPLIFYGNTVTSAPRFLNILLPAIIIPISMIITHLITHKSKLWKAIAMISFLTILFLPLLATKDTFIRRHQYALIADYYRWIGQTTQPDATIISSDDGLFIDYYSKRKKITKPVGIGHLSPKELKDFKEKLDNILENQRPVYITNLVFTDYDRYHEFEDLIWQNYHLTQIGKKPLELWYLTPLNPMLHMSSLVRIEKKN